MKLYLSSMRLGEEKQTLREMTGPNARVALIANGLDIIPDEARRQEVIQRGVDDLLEIGLEPIVIDLREFFGSGKSVNGIIAPFNVMFVTGGNAFVLRRALKQSGLDVFLWDHLDRKDLVYAGYSAGICVAGPTLKNLELVDDPNVIPAGYDDAEVPWEGLGLIEYSLIPHYKSDHFESDAINRVIERCIEDKMLFKALKDGEVVIRG